MVLAHETLLFSLRSACACIPDQNLGEVAAKILDGYALSMESYNIVSTIVGSLESRQTLLELSSKLGLTNDPYLLAAQRTDDQRIAMLLVSIFTSKYEEDAVLRLRGDCAQYFLDVVQETFDKGLLRDEHSRMARRIVRKLSEACDKLPNSLFITGVSGREEYASFGGGYGDIFQALYNQKPVALKRMRYFIHESDLRLINLKFCREALVWKDLRHPHILPFLGIDRDSFPPTLCMVSPWMKHGTVMHYLKDHGIANIDQLLYEIAQGLQYLHSNNIVHGDLRGTNILINEKESACLTDFGLSNFSDATSSMTTNRGGSSYWMAPELLDPDRFGIKFARTPASDVYAFGCVCFELYTGQPPFANLIEPAALMKILNGARPDRPVGSPVVSDILWRHVSEYWAHHPKIRPVTQLVVQNMKSLCPKTSASPTVSLPPSLSLPLARSAAPTPVQTPGILPPEFSPQSFVENVSHDANPQPVGDQYEILFDYQAPTDDPTETPISFHEGEIVYVLKERGVWAEVIKANGSIGKPSHSIG
ncbi:kinase-like domain-containing protein [Mycena galopus ATCC 62051]|nr:kinase-like domain-containing protein [Mycena galopus ATCC 62051]